MYCIHRYIYSVSHMTNFCALCCMEKEGKRYITPIVLELHETHGMIRVWQNAAKSSHTSPPYSLSSFSCKVSARENMAAVTFGLLMPQVYFQDYFTTHWCTSQAPSYGPTTFKDMYLRVFSSNSSEPKATWMKFKRNNKQFSHYYLCSRLCC